MHDQTGSRWTDRAPRFQMKRLARLRWSGQEEVVSLENVSRTGVRLRVPREATMTVADAVNGADLFVRVASDARRLPVHLVRVCGLDDRHVDLAFRFADEVPENELLGFESLIYMPDGMA